MNLQNLFRLLEDLEGQMASLYRLYSEFFAPDEEASQLFYKLSLDEKSHGSVVQYEKRLFKQNPRLFADVAMDLDALRAECERVKTLRSVRKAPKLQEAVKTALELESGAAERHYRLAMREANPEVARVLNSLGTADKQHGETLEEFAVKRGFLKAAPRSGR